VETGAPPPGGEAGVEEALGAVEGVHSGADGVHALLALDAQVYSRGGSGRFWRRSAIASDAGLFSFAWGGGREQSFPLALEVGRHLLPLATACRFRFLPLAHALHLCFLLIALAHPRGRPRHAPAVVRSGHTVPPCPPRGWPPSPPGPSGAFAPVPPPGVPPAPPPPPPRHLQLPRRAKPICLGGRAALPGGLGAPPRHSHAGVCAVPF